MQTQKIILCLSPQHSIFDISLNKTTIFGVKIDKDVLAHKLLDYLKMFYVDSMYMKIGQFYRNYLNNLLITVSPLINTKLSKTVLDIRPDTTITLEIDLYVEDNIPVFVINSAILNNYVFSGEHNDIRKNIRISGKSFAPSKHVFKRIRKML